jgi:hypothetical protein
MSSLMYQNTIQLILSNLTRFSLIHILFQINKFLKPNIPINLHQIVIKTLQVQSKYIRCLLNHKLFSSIYLIITLTTFVLILA